MSMEFFFLDVGPREYGDSILCRKGEELILVDGGHEEDWKSRPDGFGKERPALQDQISKALQLAPPFKLKLLVVTHAHKDHIGSLPKLVKDGILTAEWALVADEKYGWGRHGETDGFCDGGSLSPAAKAVLMALREDMMPDLSDDSAVAKFLADAEQLDVNYVEMLLKLKKDGTKVVRYGRNRTTDLIEAFKSWGLTILGPSKRHLVACADAIHDALSDAAIALQAEVEVPGFADSETSRVDLYRRLVSNHVLADGEDLMDGGNSRPGKALNNQSIILAFGGENDRVLLAGDMQFVKPGIRAIAEDMRTLWEKVKSHGTYLLIKTCHHTSDNGINIPWIRDMGWGAVLVHSGGENGSHPERGRLAELSDRAAEVPDSWLRNDRNGMISCKVADGEITFDWERGTVDDFSENHTRDGWTTGKAPPLEQPLQPVLQFKPAPAPAFLPAALPEGFVEVSVKIPHQRTKVTITIDVAPGTAQSGQAPVPPSLPPPQSMGGQTEKPGMDSKLLGGGRKIPHLLAVTDRTRLSANVGAAAADTAIRMLREAGLNVIENLPSIEGGSLAVREEVRKGLTDGTTNRGGYLGVLLVGGHDVVPHVVVDALPQELRDHLTAHPPQANQQDPDDFIVWSDHPYGDLDGKGANEIPVSRVPDGHSADLLLSALRAPAREPQAGAAFGLRNLNRPFADAVFQKVGENPCLTSATSAPGNFYPAAVDSARIYLMLHGGYDDASVFRGEVADDDDTQIPAFDLTCLPDKCSGAVVFTGCCWGALTLNRPAAWSGLPGKSKMRTTEDSLALAFLGRGARAYIGCTGVHYSPDAPPYSFLGGPMHSAFWEAMNETSMWPALALHQARLSYLNGLPHGQTQATFQAAEYKTFHQFTCLGLGW